jgi:hypothetical protein
MRPWTRALLPAVVTMGVGLGATASAEEVPLYTGEDLDRMFGPAPAGPSVPVDKSRPEDWVWVEQFLDREYARIDADRQHDLNSREVAISERQAETPDRSYGGSLLWGYGAGYPGYGGWDVAGPGFGGRVGAQLCRAQGFRLAPASVATSMKRAGGSRPFGHSHRVRSR